MTEISTFIKFFEKNNVKKNKYEIEPIKKLMTIFKKYKQDIYMHT